MTTVLLTIHIIVAILLIGVVLMQRGQDGGIGGIGGGSSQSLFGSGGSGSFLVKATGVLAATFMMTSLSLAFFSQKEAGSVLDGAAPAGVVQQQQAPQGGAAFDTNQLEGDAAEALPAAE